MSVRVDGAALFGEMMDKLTKDGDFTADEAGFVANAVGLEGKDRENFLKYAPDRRFHLKNEKGEFCYEKDLDHLLYEIQGNLKNRPITVNKFFSPIFQNSANVSYDKPILDQTRLENLVKIYTGLKKSLEPAGAKMGLFIFFPESNT